LPGDPDRGPDRSSSLIRPNPPAETAGDRRTGVCDRSATCRSVLQTSFAVPRGRSPDGRSLDSLELTRVWHHERMSARRRCGGDASAYPDARRERHPGRPHPRGVPNCSLVKERGSVRGGGRPSEPEGHPTVGIGPEPPARIADSSGIADSNDSQGLVNDLGGLFGRIRQIAPQPARRRLAWRIKNAPESRRPRHPGLPAGGLARTARGY
jgi:hypothetical protein